MATLEEQSAAVDQLIKGFEQEINKLRQTGGPEPIVRVKGLTNLARAHSKNLKDVIWHLRETALTEKVWEERRQAVEEKGLKTIQIKAAAALEEMLNEDEKLAKVMKELLQLLLMTHLGNEMQWNEPTGPQPPG